MSIKPCWLLIVYLVAANGLAQAVCNSAVPRSTPDAAFTIHDDGTVTHTATGLMWMRCVLGQTWNGAFCSGTGTTFTWQGALQAAGSYAYAGYSDWHLPNKNELISIFEKSCIAPALNTSVFPSDTGHFWSSSPFFTTYYAWGVDSYGGNVTFIDRTYGGLVRLVRGGQ